jgi:hypothetical protein
LKIYIGRKKAQKAQLFNYMSDFVFAMVSIVYALVCLTKESDQGKCSTSDSVEDSSKKGAEGDPRQ